jgi:hypothetical protein
MKFIVFIIIMKRLLRTRVTYLSSIDWFALNIFSGTNRNHLLLHKNYINLYLYLMTLKKKLMLNHLNVRYHDKKEKIRFPKKVMNSKIKNVPCSAWLWAIQSSANYCPRPWLKLKQNEHISPYDLSTQVFKLMYLGLC